MDAATSKRLRKAEKLDPQNDKPNEAYDVAENSPSKQSNTESPEIPLVDGKVEIESRLKKNRYERWQEIYNLADQHIRPYLDEYRENGFMVRRNTISDEVIQMLLCGQDDEASAHAAANHRLQRRAHIARERWMGAIRAIAFNREIGGGVCAVRMKGRYDLPLPPKLARRMEAELESQGVMQILKSICPIAKIRTQNVMLSAPGSERQPVHTDSSWSGCPHLDPVPHYVTVLIPLTEQDDETGGTRLWPKSHRDFNMVLGLKDGFVDMVRPRIDVGDALIFDGLLSHCGMENVSKSRDRYFFYLAFSSRHDPNTDVTG
jgi:ectoine hydroxylase-related dioxygenase (phytanoyl-CoA dioxygenase family)